LKELKRHHPAFGYKIAELSGMQIVNQFRRPVLNRSEKDTSAYSETIFLMKENLLA
jgi:hypothetical protein